MEAIRRALECAVLAGKLRMAAQGKDERTAVALQRAADRYSRGASEALAGIVADGAERSAAGPAGQATGLGRFTRPADGMR